MLALPRPKVSPQILGALIAAVALGGAFLALALKAGPERPGFYFYVFSIIGLGSALRVISHPKPVYAALYFVVTILSSSALYLMLRAEFMAFALIIIYAGAILITYLFVIMLAEQAPSDDDIGSSSPFDRFSREPAMATAVGFVLLAALTAMLARGVGAGELQPAGSGLPTDSELLAEMPKKVLHSLSRVGAFDGLYKLPVNEVGGVLDADARTIRLKISDETKFHASLDRSDFAALFPGDTLAYAKQAKTGDVVTLALPASLRNENIDGVGFALIAGHPMALELAGVILLMAMLGAVVLARRQIEIGEDEKAQRAASAPAK